MNRLSKETSPYLLQHAHNPVDWYAWKPEAFERAKKEDKPILVSIGYSTCHWCHVMERESFENENTAAFMNLHFINIKVDREERPDVDQIYMEACQIVSGSGGWPLNCFLTPDGRPFYAATYFPPEPKYNRPSWIQVLSNIMNSFNLKRGVIEDQANRLMEIINSSDSKLLNLESEELIKTQTFDGNYLENIFYKLRERFDRLEGGFGNAPKFPGTMTLDFLLQYAYHTPNEEAKEHALFSIDKMINGGIYDQLGGGFSRYTVDRSWLVPHFEKMLYDNALLVSLICDAYKLTNKDLYKQTIEETLEYIEREMTNSEGGFYSAQDADSEGEEGKFYVWSKAEIEEALGGTAKEFCDFYDISEEGNWEGKNILRRLHSISDFAKEKGFEEQSLKNNLQTDRQKLFKIRDQRIYPGLDDKILLDWNALMCSAYANAYKAIGHEKYKNAAVKNLNFPFEKFLKEEGPKMFHTYKNGTAQYDAFFNDYAYLIKAVFDVFEITYDFSLLEKAKSIIAFVQEQFYDAESDQYFFTAESQQDIVARKKEIYDSATPSGNAVMVANLLKAAIILEESEYSEIAHRMLVRMKGAIATYPGSFTQWAQGIIQSVYISPEIAILGKNAFELTKKLTSKYFPGSVLMASIKENNDYELLKNRFEDKETLIYLCRNYTCQQPVKTIEELIELL